MCDDDRIPTREEHEKSEADDWVTAQREEGNWPTDKGENIRVVFNVGGLTRQECALLMSQTNWLGMRREVAPYRVGEEYDD